MITEEDPGCKLLGSNYIFLNPWTLANSGVRQYFWKKTDPQYLITLSFDYISKKNAKTWNVLGLNTKDLDFYFQKKFFL